MITPRIIINRARLAWRRKVTCRQRWKWAGCTAFTARDCCSVAYRDGDSMFMGCQADLHNDWVAARFWRRWVAEARDVVAMLRKGRAS